jgi:hypothetical protein
VICPVIPIEAPIPPDVGATREELHRWLAARAAWGAQLRGQLDEAEACYVAKSLEVVRLENLNANGDIALQQAERDIEFFKSLSKGKPTWNIVLGGVGLGVAAGFVGAILLP